MIRITKMASTLLMAITAIVAVACLPGCTSGGPTTKMDAADARTAMEDADTIVLQKDWINFGDHWAVIADGQEVAEINGEFIKIWDTYALRSTDGSPIAAEEEQFSLITAHAKRLDADWNEDGYYDQEFTLLFAKIDFYDSRDRKTGSIEQDLALTLDADIKDANGNVAWHMNKAFISLGARITIEKVDSRAASEMDVVDAVFSAAILNELTESNSSNTTTTSRR